MLERLKLKLGIEGDEEDSLLNILLEDAQDIINHRRNTDTVEPRFRNMQVDIAVALYNKRGAEGQTAHSENGIVRTYESGDIPPSLLARIPYVARTFPEPIEGV